MIVRRKGGMTEMIPNPQERRDGVIRDHVLELLENLHGRIGRIERRLFICEDEAVEFERVFVRIRGEEVEGFRVELADGVPLSHTFEAGSIPIKSNQTQSIPSQVR